MGRHLRSILVFAGIVLILLGVYLFLSGKNEEETAFKEAEKIKEEIVSVKEEKREESSIFLGILKMPSLSSEKPVLKEFSEENLDRSPCLQYGNLEEKAVIAGHNFKGHLDNIHELKEGDSISIETTEGKEFFYTLAKKDKVKPTDIDKVMETEYPLVIYTCNYNGKARLAFYFNKQ